MQKRRQIEWVARYFFTKHINLITICNIIGKFKNKVLLTSNLLLKGQIPMRWLVYRVKPLPRSMLPFVWDFGQLRTEVEQMYIKQMVLRNVSILYKTYIQLLFNIFLKICYCDIHF